MKANFFARHRVGCWRYYSYMSKLALLLAILAISEGGPLFGGKQKDYQLRWLLCMCRLVLWSPAAAD